LHSINLSVYCPLLTVRSRGLKVLQLHEWAARWAVPWQAVVELQRIYGLEGTAPLATVSQPTDATEDAVKARVRLEAARIGIPLWRNNVGALQDKTGRFVRYGLANESERINKRIKSADLIGIRPVTITRDMEGQRIGQFVSREVKEAGWSYDSRDEHQQAQYRWLQIVTGAGGDAKFVTGEGSFT
jgi:hypothetical protein